MPLGPKDECQQMLGKHQVFDPETEDAADQASDVPFHIHGVGEEDVHDEQRPSSDHGLFRGAARPAGTVFEEKL